MFYLVLQLDVNSPLVRGPKVEEKDSASGLVWFHAIYNRSQHKHVVHFVTLGGVPLYQESAFVLVSIPLW